MNIELAEWIGRSSACDHDFKRKTMPDIMRRAVIHREDCLKCGSTRHGTQYGEEHEIKWTPLYMKPVAKCCKQCGAVQ